MSISTLSFNTSTRTSMLRLQTQLNTATLEANDGRLSDVGKSLGRLTGSAVSARAQETSFKEQQTSNGLVATRLSNIDAGLATVFEGATLLANNLIATGSSTDWVVIADQAKSGLQQMAGALNSSADGQYLFGGTNTDAAPLAAYTTANSGTTPQQQATTAFNEFLAAAGKTPATVTKAEITAYLTTGFADPADPSTVYKFGDLFQSGWSNATTGQISSSISRTETIGTSASADDKAFRDIASAYTALSAFGLGSLNTAARDAVISTVREQLQSAGVSITAQRASIGTKLNRIEASNSELQRQQDIAASTVSALEDVDLVEAGQRVSALKLQLEAAYTITGKIQNLSLLNYI